MFTTFSGLLGYLPQFITRNSGKSPLFSSTLTTVPDAASTLTAAQLLGGFLEQSPSVGRTDTTDTGANLDAAMGSSQNVGDWFDTQLSNLGSAAITLAAGSGVTIRGNTSVAAGKTAFLVFRRTAAATWTVYSTVSA